MTEYQKLKAIQGLVVSLDEQIFRAEQFKRVTVPETEIELVNQYYKAVGEILDGALEDES